MKAKLFLPFLTFAIGLFFAGASPNASAETLSTNVVSSYAVAARGPHQRLWQQVVSQTNFAGETGAAFGTQVGQTYFLDAPRSALGRIKKLKTPCP